MDRTKPIVGSCIFIGLAGMGQTAYIVYHNRVAAEQEQRRQELIAKEAADAIKAAEGKAAWNAAVKDLPVQLLVWFIEEQVRTKTPAVSASQVSVKVYERSDVIWRDAKNVTIKGYLISTPDSRPKSIPVGDIRRYFSWSRDVVRLDDGSWRAKDLLHGGMTIEPANMTKAERDAMLTVDLR